MQPDKIAPYLTSAIIAERGLVKSGTVRRASSARGLPKDGGIGVEPVRVLLRSVERGDRQFPRGYGSVL